MFGSFSGYLAAFSFAIEVRLLSGYLVVFSFAIEVRVFGPAAFARCRCHSSVWHVLLVGLPLALLIELFLGL